MEVGNVFDGRYRLIKRIGLGGFSEVWLVRDQMALDSEFALKIYKPKESLDPQAIQQFRQEFLQLINLAHPNVIRVYNYSIFDGMPYLVLPYFDRGNLSKLIQHRHLINKSFITDLFIQISEGLAYLHSKQIIHRDIKPDNILVSNEDTFIITDLGISDSLRQTISITNYKRDAVSVPYAAPEMLERNSYPDQKSDVFSLGVLMFEVITNSLPWNGIGGVGVKQSDWNLRLSEEFKLYEKIINRCVDPNPKNRPLSHEIASILKSESGNRVKFKIPYKAFLSVFLIVMIGFSIYALHLSNDNPSSCDMYSACADRDSEGLRWVRNNNKYGFINSAGVEVIPLIYDDVFPFSEGLAPVKLRGKWGYIDATGSLIIDAKFQEATVFKNNIAKVRDGTGVYKINNKGDRQ